MVTYNFSVRIYRGHEKAKHFFKVINQYQSSGFAPPNWAGFQRRIDKLVKVMGSWWNRHVLESGFKTWFFHPDPMTHNHEKWPKQKSCVLKMWNLTLLALYFTTLVGFLTPGLKFWYNPRDCFESTKFPKSVFLIFHCHQDCITTL